MTNSNVFKEFCDCHKNAGSEISKKNPWIDRCDQNGMCVAFKKNNFSEKASKGFAQNPKFDKKRDFLEIFWGETFKVSWVSWKIFVFHWFLKLRNLLFLIYIFKFNEVLEHNDSRFGCTMSHTMPLQIARCPSPSSLSLQKHCFLWGKKGLSNKTNSNGFISSLLSGKAKSKAKEISL